MELTKDYFDQQLGNLARKEDLEEIKDDLCSIRTDITEVKQVLANIDQRDKEDSDAFAKTLIQHDERLISAEKDIKQLKLKHSTS